MKFIECEDTPRKNTNLVKFITEFQKSGIKYAKVEDWNYYSAECGAANINRAAKRINRPHIKAFTRNGEIFVVNEILNK